METKYCSKCKTEKLFSEFHKRKDRKCGLATHCKDCSHQRYNDWRIKNKQRRKENLAVWVEENPERARVNWRNYENKKRRELVEYIQSVKNHPCLDCGKSFPPFAMDFDHRPDEKKYKCVSAMAGSRCSLEAIQAEIEKCDIVCAVCHRIRTWNRMQKD